MAEHTRHESFNAQATHPCSIISAILSLTTEVASPDPAANHRTDFFGETLSRLDPHSERQRDR